MRVETDGVIYHKVDHTHSLVLHMRCVCPCNLARTACGNTEDRTHRQPIPNHVLRLLFEQRQTGFWPPGLYSLGANSYYGAIFGLGILLTSFSTNLRGSLLPINFLCFGHLRTTACLPIAGAGRRCTGALLPSSCGQSTGGLLSSHLCSGLVDVQASWVQ